MTPIHTSPKLAAADATAPSAAQPANNAKNPVAAMAADFEAIFVRQMLATMRTSSLGKGLFDGQGMEQFRDMQDSMIAENMAERGVFGIANLLTRHVENNVGTTAENIMEKNDV